MAPSGFTFPPPPPPPPPVAAMQPPPHHSGSYQQHGSSRGGARGRGRGNSFGGQRGGGHYGTGNRQAQHHANGHSSYGSSLPAADRHHAQGPWARPNSAVPKVKAPPPVPSFGFSLPPAPKTTEPASSSPANKKRKHNLLGLTPRAADHESSEDDADEEARLGAGASTSGVAFMHGGKLMALRTPADIVAWIADRRRNFPTRARAQERAEEARQAEEQRLVQRREKALSRTRHDPRDTAPRGNDIEHIQGLLGAEGRSRPERNETARLEPGTQTKRVDGAENTISEDRAEKARPLSGADQMKPTSKAEKAIQKANRLREKYERAQKKAAAIEAKQKAKTKAVELNNTDGNCNALHEAPPAPATQLGTSSSVPRADAHDRPESSLESPARVQAHGELESCGSDISDLSSSLDENDDESTSSSGSSLDSDSDAESALSTRSFSRSAHAPERAGPGSPTHSMLPKPPARPALRKSPAQLKRQPCHAMQKTGTCPRGEGCPYSHDAARLGPRDRDQRPRGGRKATNGKRREEPKPFVTLYQRLLARQMEEERNEQDTKERGATKGSGQGTPVAT